MPEDSSAPLDPPREIVEATETSDTAPPRGDTAEQEPSEQVDVVGPNRADSLHPVIGLGGSAGSLNALRTFFSHMATDSGLAFVVIIHLSPDHESSLAALLQGSTSMPVVQVRDTVKVEANCVYVIPPAKHLSLTDGQLRLTELWPERGRRVAVDLFFRTLADTHGTQATAIVLSGADSDGSIGLKRVKERGGLTIAQDPEEAEHSGMPRAAIATGMVDWILPAAEMPAQLLKYYRNEPRAFSRQKRLRKSRRSSLPMARQLCAIPWPFCGYARATTFPTISAQRSCAGLPAACKSTAFRNYPLILPLCAHIQARRERSFGIC